jgi:hypothetical protein
MLVGAEGERSNKANKPHPVIDEVYQTNKKTPSIKACVWAG